MKDFSKSCYEYLSWVQAMRLWSTCYTAAHSCFGFMNFLALRKRSKKNKHNPSAPDRSSLSSSRIRRDSCWESIAQNILHKAQELWFGGKINDVAMQLKHKKGKHAKSHMHIRS